MEKELLTKIEELGRLHKEFKESNEKELAEIKKHATASGLTIEKVEKTNEAISKLEDEIKSIRTAMNRTGGQGGATEVDQKAAEYKKAFNKYARKGVGELELKTMSADSDADGGFLVPIEMSSEIVKKVFESSPLRNLASVQSISTSSLEILEDIDEMASGWTSEQGSRSNTNTATLKKVMIPVHELYAMPAATQTLLDDAAINLESWIAGKVAEKFARDEATAFISGDGVSKPKGILSYTSGTGFGQIEQVVSGSAAALTADGLIDLVYSLKEPYKPGASFLMQRASVKAVRKLKDSQNRYLWEPGLNGKTASSLLGYEIYEAADMATIGANALAVAFGDFRQGYQIVDRIGIRLIRDPYSSKPYVLFYTTKRVGGGVKNFEAIKIQKCST